MASSDQNSLRTPLPGYCLVTLTDAPASPWLVHSERCRAQSQEILGQVTALSPGVASTAPSLGSSSVLSSKTGRLDQSSGRLEGPAHFSAPWAWSPSSFPKLSHAPPAGPVQPVCRVALGKGLPRMRVRERAQVSRSLQFDSWCCEYRNPGQGTQFPYSGLSFLLSEGRPGAASACTLSANGCQAPCLAHLQNVGSLPPPSDLFQP